MKGCTSSPGSEGLIFSYANDMIASQAIRGLASAEQQREVLKVMVKDGLSKIELPWLTTFITALEESGEAAKSLGGGAEVNGVSGHRQNRNNQRQGGNQGGNGSRGGAQTSASSTSCSGCGSPKHKKGDPACRASKVTCNTCKMVGHYSSVCPKSS